MANTLKLARNGAVGFIDWLDDWCTTRTAPPNQTSSEVTSMNRHIKQDQKRNEMINGDGNRSFWTGESCAQR